MSAFLATVCLLAGMGMLLYLAYLIGRDER